MSHPSLPFAFNKSNLPEKFICQSKVLIMSEALYSSEETTFPVDDVSKIIKSAVEEVIERNTYQHNKVKQWCDKIVEQVLSNLKDLNKPFKYIATCVVMQKNGAGLHTSSSCYWDNTTDGSCTVRWENKSMYCIVSVFGLAI